MTAHSNTHPETDALRILSFESRRADDMAGLIERHGGVPWMAPSMREVPLEDNTEAIRFADRLIAGEIDVVVLLTGVGLRTLVEAVAQHHPADRLAAALGRVTTVARGPKPIAALRKLGVTPTVTVPEPNTWRDVLAALDEHAPVNGRTVAVQEYGQSNPELLDGLRKRGANVHPVPVYRWALPEDVGPLERAVDAVADGQVDVAMFTSATQAQHLWRVAESSGRLDALRDGFKRVVVASIGPVCSEALKALSVRPDIEPDRPRMGFLVAEVARQGREALTRKRAAAAAGVDTLSWKRIDAVWTEAEKTGGDASLDNCVFLRACRREPTDYTPIWLMRQAGRYMREYRELRAGMSFLELCRRPDLAAEVTLSAVDRLGVDAAIIFADILLILEPMDIGLEFTQGDGPRIRKPVRDAEAVRNLREIDVNEAGSSVFEALRITRRALSPSKALVGFAGAPFTLASYVIEGGGSRHYQHTKSLMYRDVGAWNALMEHLVRGLIGYLGAQVAAGAQALQLFDSWVGCLSPEDYRTFVLPHTRAVIDGLPKGVPVIHFGTGTGTFLEALREAGGDVIGLDWRVPLDEGWRRVGYDVGVQGNLEPAILFASPSEIRRRTHAILDQAAGRPGHIFNLGHGVLPQTPVEHVQALVDIVHEYEHGS